MNLIGRIVIIVLFGWSTMYGVNNVKNLWKTKKTSSKKISNKRLRKKPKSVPANKKSRRHNTIDKIEKSKSKLKQTSSIQKQMNRQLERIAETIQRTTLENIVINKVIKRLRGELKKNEARYNKAQSSISQHGAKIEEIGRNIDLRHQAYIKLLSDQFMLILTMRTQGGSGVESIVRHEIYEALKKKNTMDLRKLKAEIDGSKKRKKNLLNKQRKIKMSISSLRAKRDLYDRKKKEKRALLKKLAKKEGEYRTKLNEIIQSQRILHQTLAKLKIIREKEIVEAKRVEQERREELKRRIAQRIEQQSNRLSDSSDEGIMIVSGSSATSSVKQYGSSYQTNNIQVYRGTRTISPLKNGIVVKKFGPYIDPIYKFKIFNDNIVLRSPISGAKVRNVLNGKVVYVGQNSMLGKVIIVEHSNRLHTMYAALDRISPMLHVGGMVKKGVIIGRIKHRLIFLATQNSKYINPLRLIRL